MFPATITTYNSIDHTGTSSLLAVLECEKDAGLWIAGTNVSQADNDMTFSGQFTSLSGFMVSNDADVRVMFTANTFDNYRVDVGSPIKFENVTTNVGGSL